MDFSSFFFLSKFWIVQGQLIIQILCFNTYQKWIKGREMGHAGHFFLALKTIPPRQVSALSPPIHSLKTPSPTFPSTPHISRLCPPLSQENCPPKIHNTHYTPNPSTSLSNSQLPSPSPLLNFTTTTTHTITKLITTLSLSHLSRLPQVKHKKNASNKRLKATTFIEHLNVKL
ncbi:unnamed protein product [Coffea canephora]|uniref:Uncharacterized protein n=1 Tax=Coffea canephora TaxID=49390 RepID=A0A068USZ9_COFCA|nr:unnamed protein product [Coffea canephora]